MLLLVPNLARRGIPHTLAVEVGPPVDLPENLPTLAVTLRGEADT
jgi:hypothetical protein